MTKQEDPSPSPRKTGARKRPAGPKNRWSGIKWTAIGAAVLTAIHFTVNFGAILEAIHKVTNWFTEEYKESRIRELAEQLRDEYPLILRNAPPLAASDIKKINELTEKIKKLDPKNGFAFYYDGELARIRAATLFRLDSCIIAAALAEKPQSLDQYQKNFRFYIEEEHTQTVTERGGSTSRQRCYERARGFCPQRTAWIYHLLANDFFAEATSSGLAQDVRIDKLRDALKFAEMAASLYEDPDTKKRGFVQCTSTEVLIGRAKELLSKRD